MGQPFRPARVTQKPINQGPGTAVITGQRHPIRFSHPLKVGKTILTTLDDINSYSQKS